VKKWFSSFSNFLSRLGNSASPRHDENVDTSSVVGGQNFSMAVASTSKDFTCELEPDLVIVDDDPLEKMERPKLNLMVEDVDDSMDQIQLKPFTADSFRDRDDSIRGKKEDQFISLTPIMIKESSVTRSPIKKI